MWVYPVTFLILLLKRQNKMPFNQPEYLFFIVQNFVQHFSANLYRDILSCCMEANRGKRKHLKGCVGLKTFGETLL